ncbi:His Kinase A (Phospho-acceptor) domain-containing protein [Tenacibaculum sp. 190130A14a]|uniref:histidine kinase n=1 Tax=Tenacibaculum polynesiense TaxID=3137857 RepID=A0ABP1F4X6_9FLAO
MTKKNNLLIIASVLGLLSLSLVQGYLIKNTYTLKKESFVNKVNQEVSRIDDYTPAIDSINEVWQKSFIKTLDKYSLKTISKKNVLSRLREVTDSLNKDFIKEYERELKRKKLGYGLEFHKKVSNIILVDSVKTDTLFHGKENPVYRLLGHDFIEQEKLQISNSVWHTERSFTKTIDGKVKRSFYQLYFETKDYINIDEWNSIVFNQMKGLLVLSFMVFLFVFGLMYYSIKNLINQKRISDIKTDFINNITHELKTPLATLTLATKMLGKREVKEQSNLLDATIKTVERQNVRLQKLIDQVLDNSLGFREIILEKKEVRLSAYLHTLLNDFELSVKERNVNLNLGFSDVDIIVFIDKFYFTTALLNILDNAVKYGSSNIIVNVEIKHEHLEIGIKDDGIGVSRTEQELLFDKFYRVPTKEVHNVKGLGLGLYYSNQVVKAHRGSISLESKEGKGTLFVIKIPKN